MGVIFPYQQGGAIQLNDANETGRANMFVTSNGGYLYLYDNSSTPALKIRLEGATGDAYFSRNVSVTGKITGGSFGAVASSGAVSGTSLSTTGNLTVSGTGTFSNPITCGGLTAKTQIVAANNAGTSKVFFAATDTYGYGALKNANGDNNIYLRGDTGVVECVRVQQNSSRKVKENIKPIEDSAKILELQAVSFDYKDKVRGTDCRGFIAEDVAEILPNLVAPETEETTASLDYISIIPYLQDIIKKQQKQIDYLMAEVEKLKGEK